MRVRVRVEVVARVCVCVCERPFVSVEIFLRVRGFLFFFSRERQWVHDLPLRA